MDKPIKVGIAIATYNSSFTITECLESIVKQKFLQYKDRPIGMRILIVDDGSTDNTVDVLNYLCAKYSALYGLYIGYITLDKNSGSCAKPYNIAFGYLSQVCDYVYKVDSDDKLRQDAVYKMVSRIEETGADWVNSNYQMFGEQNNYVELQEGVSYLNFETQNRLSAFAMWRSECWRENKGFREDMAYEDWEMWIRLLKAGYTYAVVKEPIYYYRTHANQESRKQGYRHDQALLNIKKSIYG